MDSMLLRDILGFGLLRGRTAPDSAIEALRIIGPEAAAGILIRHKVRSIARARIREVTNQDPVHRDLLHELNTELARLAHSKDLRAATIDAQLAAFQQSFGDIRVLLMKGLGVREWYTPDHPRDVGDADLWVPDSDSGWEVVRRLRGLGYQYQPGELPWLKRDQHGVLFGQIRLQHPDPEKLDVDVHIGPYSVRYCGLITFGRSAEVPSWRPLAPEDNLCAVIGNAAGDCFLDAKTINDVALALTRPLDFDYVADNLAAAELSGFTNAVLDQVRATCELDERAAAAAQAMYREGGKEDIALAETLDWDRRAEIVTGHARRMGRRFTGSDTAAEAIAREAELAYREKPSYRLRVSGGAPHRLPAMNPWTCVRLAPQELLRRMCQDLEPSPLVERRHTSLARNLDHIESSIGDLVAFGEDVFLPTVDYLFCRNLVAADLVGDAAGGRP